MISLDLPFLPRRYIHPRPSGNDLVLVIPVCMLGASLTLSKFKQEFSCFFFYFCFFFFFRFGFIFLCGLLSSSYKNINSFSPSVINTVTLVNTLGLQSTNERLAVAHRLGSGGRSEDIGCITIKFSLTPLIRLRKILMSLPPLPTPLIDNYFSLVPPIFTIGKK